MTKSDRQFITEKLDQLFYEVETSFTTEDSNGNVITIADGMMEMAKAMHRLVETIALHLSEEEIH